MSDLDLMLLLGGVRSGKSAAALRLVEDDPSGRVLFVATAEAHDDEMRRRIDVHRGERKANWRTLEAPLALASELDAGLATSAANATTVVIDCLTLWVSNVLLALDENDDAEAILVERTAELLAVLRRHSDVGDQRRRWVIVSNEVGLGIVPATPLGRRYRDALGRTNQLVAAAAKRVEFMAAGLTLRLKG